MNHGSVHHAGSVVPWRLGAALVLVGAVALAGQATSNKGLPAAIDATAPTPPSPIATSSPTAEPTPTITSIDLGGLPLRSPAATDTGLWIAVESVRDESTSAVRVDAGSGAVETLMGKGNAPFRVAAGEGAVWVGGCPHRKPTNACPDGTLYRVDPTSGAVTGRVRLGGDLDALAVGDGAVWVGQHTYVNGSRPPGYLFRIDPVTLQSRRFGISYGPHSPECCVHWLAAGGESVWVGWGERERLIRFDPSTGRATALDLYGLDSTFAEGYLWIVGGTDKRLQSSGLLRVDPPTNRWSKVDGVELSVIPGFGLASGGGAVWLATASSDPNDRMITIRRIEPSTPTASVFQTVTAGPPKVSFECGGCGWTVDAAYGQGELWVTVHDRLEVLRFAPA